jgi:hypothetical protein
MPFADNECTAPVLAPHPKEPTMSLHQHHPENRDDQSQTPADARNNRTNALADRARMARINGTGSIGGWGPRLF